MSKRGAALWWLANKIRAYSESGQFDDKGWFAYCGGEPPTTETCRCRIIYGSVLLDGYLADMQPNPLVVQALQSAGYPLDSENHKKLHEALLAAGVTRTAAAWLKPPKMLNPTFPLLEQIDTLVNRLADPPCQETGRTVLDALVDALRAIAPAPKKPSRDDDKRFKAFELGLKREKIAGREGVSERAIDASMRRVRDWREFHGLATGAKGQRGKKRALNVVNEASVPPATIIASATVKTTK